MKKPHIKIFTDDDDDDNDDNYDVSDDDECNLLTICKTISIDTANVSVFFNIVSLNSIDISQSIIWNKQES